MRPLPGRPWRDAGSKPYHKANGTLTVLKWKNNGRTYYPQTRDKNFIRFSADANTVGHAPLSRQAAITSLRISVNFGVENHRNSTPIGVRTGLQHGIHVFFTDQKINAPGLVLRE